MSAGRTIDREPVRVFLHLAHTAHDDANALEMLAHMQEVDSGSARATYRGAAALRKEAANLIDMVRLTGGLLHLHCVRIAEEATAA